MGTHIGPATAHTTHRTVDLGFRMLMALQGHAGLEWDISSCSAAELEQLTAWTALARELRPLLHTGDLARSRDPRRHAPGDRHDRARRREGGIHRRPSRHGT